MARRLTLRFASALTIAAVTVGLVLRLPQTPPDRAATTPRLSATGRSPEPASSSPLPSPKWRIAYTLTPESHAPTEIWTVNADGSENRRVLRDASTPCWSPDRRKLAFERGGNVWVSGADGSGQRQVTFWPVGQLGESGEPLQIDGLSWNARYQLVSFARAERFGLTSPTGYKEDLWETTIYQASLLSGEHSLRFPFPESLVGKPSRWADSDLIPRQPNVPSFDIYDKHSNYRFAENSRPTWSSSGNRLAFIRNGDVWLAVREPSDKADTLFPTWHVGRIASCAEYDGGVGYGSHDTMGAVTLSWAPDESYLIYQFSRIGGAGEKTPYLVRFLSAPDTPLGVVAAPPTKLRIASAVSPSVSPDGNWLLHSGGDGIRANTLDGKHECKVVRGEITDAVW